MASKIAGWHGTSTLWWNLRQVNRRLVCCNELRFLDGLARPCASSIQLYCCRKLVMENPQYSVLWLHLIIFAVIGL